MPHDSAMEVLTRGAAALARGGRIEPALEELLAAVSEAIGARSAVVFGQDPDRPAIEPIAAIGLDDASLAALAATVADNADHPIRRTIAERTSTFDATPRATGT